MRLSAYVNQRGRVDPFTRDDFFFVGSKVSTDPARLVLVGGQAIETWGLFLEVPAPTGDQHPLTEDTDWLGGKRDAQWLCQMLGPHVDLQIAGADEPGPSSAVAFLQRPDGRIVLMDFLHSIVGPSDAEVRRLAVPIRVGGVTLHVLHPLLCLHSRLANLAVLPHKRNGNGLLQAQWAINIARAFIEKMFDAGTHPRQVIRACHRVADQAAGRHGKFCFLEFNLDPLPAVSPHVITGIGGQFEQQDWPRTTAWISGKRERWQAHRAKQAPKTPN